MPTQSGCDPDHCSWLISAGVVSTCDRQRRERWVRVREILSPPTQRTKPPNARKDGSSIGFGIALRSQISAWQSSLLRELAGWARVRKARACQHRTAWAGACRSETDQVQMWQEE